MYPGTKGSSGCSSRNRSNSDLNNSRPQFRRFLGAMVSNRSFGPLMTKFDDLGVLTRGWAEICKGTGSKIRLSPRVDIPNF